MVQTIYLLVATAELTGVVGSSCSASKVMSNPLRPKKCNMSCISIMSIPMLHQINEPNWPLHYTPHLKLQQSLMIYKTGNKSLQLCKMVLLCLTNFLLVVSVVERNSLKPCIWNNIRQRYRILQVGLAGPVSP